jgi:hypothetical protein
MPTSRVPRAGDNRPSRRTPVRSHHPKRHLAQCPATGKVRFRDKREAQDAIHRAVALRQLLGAEGQGCRRQEKRTYFCSSCNGWHLTSQESTALEWMARSA